jgi:hypothetical protein
MEFVFTKNGEKNFLRALYNSMPVIYRRDHKFDHMLSRKEKLLDKGLIFRLNAKYGAKSFRFYFHPTAQYWLQKYKYNVCYIYITTPYRNVIKAD